MRHFMSYIGCLVLASPAMATTWHVAVTGHDSNDGSQASPYATIKHAISQSSNGDTISIAEGTYFEYGIDPFGKEITITGPDRSTYGWPPPVVIDGQGHGSVLSCDSGETSSTVFKNLNIQYGHDDAGGGFYCINDSKPVLENMKFKFNTANQYGGGMYIKGDDITPTGGPTLTNVEFHTNHAGSGGAIYCQNSNPVISTHGFNPGIYKFYNNHSTDNGGAFYFVNSHGTMNGVLINGNQANWGGGIYFMGDSTTTLNQCDISFNEADSGGGIASYQSHPVLNHCNLIHNTASFEGGGIFCKQTHLSVNSTTIENNTAHEGGGIYHDGSSDPVITNSTIKSNTPSGVTNAMAVIRGNDFGEGMLVETTICSNTDDQVIGSWTHGSGNSINGICPTAPGDINGDGNVDADDLNALHDMLGINTTDVNNNGCVDIDDLLYVIEDWGEGCSGL